MAKRDAESWAAIVAEAETAGVPHGEIAKKHGVTLATLKCIRPVYGVVDLGRL